MDDPGSTSLIFQIVLLFILILVNAFFAMSEIAIISLNDSKIEKMAENGHKKAKQIMRLTENSSSFLSTIQIGVTLAGFLTSASASQVFAQRLTDAVSPILPDSIPVSLIHSISVVLITLIMSYFSLVFGELAPKRIAMQVPEKISFLAVGPLLFVAKITKPAVKLLSFSTNLVVRIFGFDPNSDEETVTEEEIRMMVDVGQEKGVIEDTQKEMIDNIFEFDDIDVSDIMTHRTDMYAVEANDSLQDVIDISVEQGYSRIPVYDDDPDNIIGIAYIKDLIQYIGKSLPENGLRSIMRKAYYVPESKKCGQLFKEMSESHVQMAIVVDEYGGTAGLVTLEDLLESIVGNIQDEYDNEDEEISRIDDATFTIDGTTDIEEVGDLIGVTFPEGDYDTLGGYIISRLGFLPSDGEMNSLEFENFRFTVLSVEDRRIGKVKVEILPGAKTENISENETDSHEDV